jgi:hypothetical protein
MKKELIKLAFQLGYNQGLEDLNKQADAARRNGFVIDSETGAYKKNPQAAWFQGAMKQKPTAGAMKDVADNVSKGRAVRNAPAALDQSVLSKAMRVNRRLQSKNTKLIKALAKNKRLALALGIGGGVGTAGAGVLGYLAGKGKSTED